MATTKTKNSNISYARGTVEYVEKLVADGLFHPPGMCFFSDKQCLGFLDTDGVLYKINLDRIEKLEEQMKGMVDPESGEPVSIPEYVEQNLAPVQNQVIYMNTEIEEIRNNGAAIMLTLKDLTDSGGGDNG